MAEFRRCGRRWRSGPRRPPAWSQSGRGPSCSWSEVVGAQDIELIPVDELSCTGFPVDNPKDAMSQNHVDDLAVVVHGMAAPGLYVIAAAKPADVGNRFQRVGVAAHGELHCELVFTCNGV